MARQVDRPKWTTLSTHPWEGLAAKHDQHQEEAGSYLRLIDFVYHTTLGLRVIKKKKKEGLTSKRCFITMIKWIRTSRLSIKKSLSRGGAHVEALLLVPVLGVLLLQIRRHQVEQVLRKQAQFITQPLEHGTYKTVKARFWLWLSVNSP